MTRYLPSIVSGLLLLLAYAAPASALSLDQMMSAGALGNAKASVTVIEYASLTCPHCAHFENDTFAAFKKKYVDTGKVRYIFRDFPLDQLGLKAAMLARCAGPDEFLGFVEALYKSQDEWAGDNDPMAALARLGLEGGVSKDQFDACMANKPLEDAIVQERLEAENKYKVDATPTFIINGEAHSGDMPLEDFDKILEPLLRKAS